MLKVREKVLQHESGTIYLVSSSTNVRPPSALLGFLSIGLFFNVAARESRLFAVKASSAPAGSSNESNVPMREMRDGAGPVSSGLPPLDLPDDVGDVKARSATRAVLAEKSVLKIRSRWSSLSVEKKWKASLMSSKISRHAFVLSARV